jgi:hypothetical protein
MRVNGSLAYNPIDNNSNTKYASPFAKNLKTISSIYSKDTKGSFVIAKKCIPCVSFVPKMVPGNYVSTKFCTLKERE